MERILRAGNRGLLVETADASETERVLALRGGPSAPLIEYAVPASHSVLVVAASEELVPGLSLAIETVFSDAVHDEADRWRPPTTHVIPTQYGGEDLAEAAELCGMTVREFVRAHAESDHRVAFFGFAPGFAYIDGTDPRLELPRRSNPRTSIPAGTVAVAARQSVVYPGGTPGGWHLIGHTDFVSWDLDRDEPTPFAVGDSVVFEPIGTPL